MRRILLQADSVVSHGFYLKAVLNWWNIAIILAIVILVIYLYKRKRKK